jgi:hypothetical protein
MAASDNLSKALFHGTKAVIKGTHILPDSRGLAWATTSRDAAKEYGSTKMPFGEVGPLKIYQVEPAKDMISGEHPYYEGEVNYGSPTGFKIVGEA